MKKKTKDRLRFWEVSMKARERERERDRQTDRQRGRVKNRERVKEERDRYIQR